MAVFQEKKFKSKSGADVIVRSAVVNDASTVLSLSKSVIDEEIYQLTSSEEFKMTVEAEEKWIQSHLDNPNHIILVAIQNAEIVGLLDFSNGHRKGIAHTGEFGMSVSIKSRDQGIGTLLLSSLVDWASKNKQLEKINLSVHSNNERAIAMYEKMGFEVEGVRKKDLKYKDGQYVDTVIMGKFL